MRSGPEVLFGTKVHQDLATCGVFHLVIYGDGFISLCAVACVHLRQRTKSTSSKSFGIMRWYYFLYYKFNPDHYTTGASCCSFGRFSSASSP